MKAGYISLTLIFLSDFTFSANLLYRQSFETPIEENPEIQWTTSGYSATQAVVNFDPYHGEKSVRGNFNPEITDPISGLKGVPFVQLKINFKDIPTISDWYPTTEKIFVSWAYRLDDCLWQGSAYSNDDPLGIRTVGKFAFLRMNEDPATSYYFTMNGGQTGRAALSANSWNDLWQAWYGRSSLWLENGRRWGSDGQWHTLSAFVGNRSDGQKYLMWWIDGALMKDADRFEADGRHKIFNGFVLDSVQFWHSAAADTDASVSRNDGICNGWQLDDFQIWNDIPEGILRSRPISPDLQFNGK